MAHHGAGSQKSDRVHLTRRELIRRLALSATVASLGRTADAAQSLSAESPASTKVRTVLESLVRDTPEIGLQVAAYLDGKLVVDAWAGLADQATERARRRRHAVHAVVDHQGVTATCMHVLVEQHKLDYDMPIVNFGPSSAPTARRPRRCAMSWRIGPAFPRRRSATRPTGWPTGTGCAAASPI